MVDTHASVEVGRVPLVLGDDRTLKAEALDT